MSSGYLSFVADAIAVASDVQSGVPFTDAFARAFAPPRTGPAAGALDELDRHLAAAALDHHPASAAYGVALGRVLRAGDALAPPDAPRGFAQDPRALAATGIGWTASVRAHRFAVAELHARGYRWNPVTWLVSSPPAVDHRLDAARFAYAALLRCAEPYRLTE